MQVLIEDIVIKDRVRTEIGDLKPLMESMRLHGQLNPITLSGENELIAGHRRTLAARELGWKFVEAHIVERASEVEKLQLELEENVHRKDFSPEELLAGYRRLDKLLHPTIGRRIGTALKCFFGKIFRRKPKNNTVPAPQAQPEQENGASTLRPANAPDNPAPKTDTNPQTDQRPPTAEKESDVIGSQFGI